jgi:hypothetical protein
MTTQFHTPRDMSPEDSAPEHASQCDCCGELKYDCEDVWVPYVGDTHACAACRGDEDQ